MALLVLAGGLSAPSARADNASAVDWYRLDDLGVPHIQLYFFWTETCPHCQEARPAVSALAAERPWLDVQSFNVTHSLNDQLWFLVVAAAAKQKASSVPAFIACGRMLAGFGGPGTSRKDLARFLDGCHAEVRGQLGLPAAPPGPAAGTRLGLPGAGALGAESLSLPMLTVVLGGLDAFNPCAFFVLMFLLSLLVHTHSRGRMALIGGVFVVTSGLLYFAFMAAWLNLFLLLRGLTLITTVAGLVAVAIAALNIKDYVWLRQGPSLSVPSGALPKLAASLRGMLGHERMGTLLLGTVALAVAANTYELLCTSGFPLVFTRVLTLRALSTPAYYAYLAAYNGVYVLPLLIIVAGFVAVLGSRRLGEVAGRRLKLLSGLMMLGLGLLLLLAPQWLERLWAAAVLLLAALGLTGMAAFSERWWLRPGAGAVGSFSGPV